MDVMDDLIRWLHSGGQIAIHDATNSTIPRRRTLLETSSAGTQHKDAVCREHMQ